MYTKVKLLVDEYMKIAELSVKTFGLMNKVAKYIAAPTLGILLASKLVEAAATNSTSLVSQINGVQLVLTQIGPALSAVLFVLAGIFYAIGQMLPPDKKANFHTAAVNIIIGAIVVGALSFASTSLAVASTHLLGNVTANSSI